MARNVISLEYCEQNLTENQSRGWKAMCPDCPSDNMWVTPDTASVFCFECGYAAKIGDVEVEPKQTQVFDIPGIRSVYNEINPVYQNHVNEGKTYLHERGIDDYMIDMFGIGFCTAEVQSVYRTDIARQAGIAAYKGIPIFQNRVTFPYIADNVITDIRARALEKDADPRYKSPYNSAAARGALYPFNYDRAYRRSLETKMLIITEGEIKAIFADMCGYAAIGLPGMSNWRQGMIVDASVTPVIIFDSVANTDDQLQTDRAIANIARRLRQPRVVQLPLLGEKKMDIDSYILSQKGGETRFKHLMENAVAFERYKQMRKF